MKLKRAKPLAFVICASMVFGFFLGFLVSSGANSATTNVDSSLSTSDLPQTSFPGRVINLERLVRFDDYGQLFTKDIVKFSNDGLDPIVDYYFCLDQHQSDTLYGGYAKTKTGTKLDLERVVYDINGYNTWKVTFPSILFPGDTAEFTIWQYFSGPTVDTNQTTSVVEFNASIFTIVPYIIDKITTGVKLPTSSILMEHDPIYPDDQAGANAIDYTSLASTPFNDVPLYVKFNNGITKILQSDRAVVTVDVNTYGDWKVTSELLVHNLGKQSISTLIFTVPVDAKNFKAEDSIGEIFGLTDPEIDDDYELEYKNVTLDLTNNRYEITSDSKFALTFSFTLPGKGRVSKGAGENIIYMDIYSICSNPWITRDLSIKVGLPQVKSVDFNNVNVLPEEVDNVDGVQYLIYRENAFSSFKSNLIIIHYKYSNFAMQARPLLISLVVGVVTSFLLIGKKIYQGRAQVYISATQDIPRDSLKEYTSIFEEKIGLYLEMESLNDDFGRRKVKKREFSIKMNDFNRKLKKMEEEILYSKKKLMEYGGRIKEVIEDLEVLEAERQSVQDSLSMLESRYKAGKIKSRVAFEKLYDKYALRLRKIQSSLDSGVNELKSYSM
ncbi:MAG: hypothetical protein ACTSUE_19500 [Promethearchaeota archaeon]